MSANNRPLDSSVYLQLLSRIAALLERNGYFAEARMIGGTAASIRSGGPLSLLASNDIWGGSGSVTDCNLQSDTGPQPKSAATVDHLEFCSLIAELATTMARDGIAEPRIVSVGETYARWGSVTD